MEAKRVRLLFDLVAVTCGIALFGTTRLAAQGNCQPVLNALSKVLATPTHIYHTMSPVLKDGSQPRREDTTYTETIYVDGSAYSKLGGSWKRSPVTVEQVKKMEEENIKNSKYVCRYLRDESTGGEAAAVYDTHSEHDGDKSDGQIWISKNKGLPLRHEFDMDAGSGMNKRHHTTRYEYTNVQPPLP